MSIEDRLRRLKDFYDPSKSAVAEQECQDRRKLGLLQFIVWTEAMDADRDGAEFKPPTEQSESSEVQRSERPANTGQCSVLPAHTCPPLFGYGEDKAAAMSGFVRKCLNRDPEIQALWVRYAPDRPFPQKEAP